MRKNFFFQKKTLSYMQVKERYSEYGSYVSFGPSVYFIDFAEKGAVIVGVQTPQISKEVMIDPRAFAESVMFH